MIASGSEKKKIFGRTMFTTMYATERRYCVLYVPAQRIATECVLSNTTGQLTVSDCRTQGQGASGIIYVLSRDDTAVVASYLKVSASSIGVSCRCTLIESL